MIFAVVDLDHSVWIDVPPFWGGESWRDEREWAEEVASNCWIDSGLPHQNADLERLTAILVDCARLWGPGSVHPEHAADPALHVHVVLHLPDPRVMPLPVRVLVAEALDGERLPSLHEFALVDDPDAIDHPEVTELEHPFFAAGLSAFRHRLAPAEPADNVEGGVFGVLRYAFPVPGHPAVLLVVLAWPDLARLAGAREDIDKLALAISWKQL